MTSTRGRGPRLAAVATLVAAIWSGLGPGLSPARAGAQTARSPEQELADTYSPIVRLVPARSTCDSGGEKYRPVPVDVVLDQPDMVLRDPDGHVVKKAPGALDLGGLGEGYYLDLPGDPLRPGCAFAEWFRRVGASVPTSVYAHIATEDGKDDQLALQYWFFWTFNDWNDKHESDWEMIQLIFPANNAAAALAIGPSEVGYAQHTGAEHAEWGSDKLTLDGTHPVVYPGVGSHAAYFDDDLFLGHGAAEGFGCDDTREATTVASARAILVPEQPTADDPTFAWLTFEGRWGEREAGPNNGPDGPNHKKSKWEQPITWSEDEWRDDAVEVPASSSIAPSTTGFFCRAVEVGSDLYLAYLRSPGLVLGGLALIIVFASWLGKRTQWYPAVPVPVDQERRAGQLLRSAFRTYRRFWQLFVGIGLVFIPLGSLATLLQYAVVRSTPVGDLVDLVSHDALLAVPVALTIGSVSAVTSTVIVFAATAEAIDHMGRGRRLPVLSAFATLLDHWWALLWATIRIVVVTALLAITIVGLPLAVFYFVRRILTTTACIMEDLDAGPALARSSDLVRGHWWRVLTVTSIANVIALGLGPLIGVTVLLLWSPSLGFVNLLSSVVYALLMPFAGITLALLFYDLRHRKARQPADDPDALAEPATNPG
jgi:hypothetical protein